MEVISWGETEVEQLSAGIGRQMLNGESMTLARIILAAGAVVPEHRHDNEQIANVLSGRLRFVIGDEEREVMAARASSSPAASRTASRRSTTRSCSTSSRRAARTGSAATTHTCAASTSVSDDLDPLEQHLLAGLRALEHGGATTSRCRR